MQSVCTHTHTYTLRVSHRHTHSTFPIAPILSHATGYLHESHSSSFLFFSFLAFFFPLKTQIFFACACCCFGYQPSCCWNFAACVMFLLISTDSGVCMCACVCLFYCVCMCACLSLSLFCCVCVCFFGFFFSTSKFYFISIFWTMSVFFRVSKYGLKKKQTPLPHFTW